MAASLIRTCLKRSITKRLLGDTVKIYQSLRPSIALVDITHSQCNCYHQTHTVFKKRKSLEEKAKLQKKRELEILNPKEKKKTAVVDVWRNMTVRELALSANRPIDDILEALYYADKENNYDRYSVFEDPAILHETVRKLGAKFKIVASPNITKAEKEDEDCDAVRRPPPDPSVCVKRRPVITIMGHVDHGKTTLLDSLRHTSVVDSEFGGITQHIGAFNVTLSNGEKMTFLDTPGHAAFSAMRARGAHATDIVILVVAADDGVMEQTVQSIKMARDANVPIIVAVNKCDKPNINIERTHQELSQNGIVVENLGGDIQSVNISALKGTNLNQLMEAVLAQAEIMDLKGEPTGLVEGVIIEASNNVGRGKLATALIQRGTLRKGDVLVSGLAWAKVRSMFDHSGAVVSQASLSDAVQIIGWRELPVAGEEILEVENERRANAVMRYRHGKVGEEKSIEQKIVADEKHRQHLVEYEKLVQKKRILGVKRLRREGPREKENVEDKFPKVNLVIKGDVVGSVEAIMDVLDTYSDEKNCKLSVVHYGVGQLTETDLELAKTFNAVVYCFNTSVPKNLSQEAVRQNISVRHHKVIYKLIDDLKLEINSKLPLVTTEEEIGQAIVLQEFLINEKRKKVKVAGCRCSKGTLRKSARFKVLRDGETIYDGTASSLRHMKDEVDTIKTNVECGLKLDNVTIDFKTGDEVVCYKLVDKVQVTEWNPGF